MTDGGVDRSVECTGNVNAMISAFECVHDVNLLSENLLDLFYVLTNKCKFNFMLLDYRDGVWPCLLVCQTKTMRSKLIQ